MSSRPRQQRQLAASHYACAGAAYLNVTEYLVELDPDTLYVPDNEGALPIHEACRSDVVSLQRIKLLVERDGGIDTLRDGYFPLHVLCGARDPLLEAVEYITKAFPEALRARSSDGAFPLHVLCGEKNTNLSLKTVKCLIEPYPAALSARTSSGELPITLAWSWASLEVIYALIRGDPHVVPS